VLSGEEVFHSQLDLINRVIAFVCRRNNLSQTDADDFASHARLMVMKGDYAVLNKFQGRSSLKTFLSITVQRIFLDYRNAAWGKWRPSAEALKRGPAAVLLEQLVWRDGYSLDEAFEIITTNHRLSLLRPEAEALYAALPVREKRRFQSDDTLTGVPASESADDGTVERDRREAAGRIGAALQDLLVKLPAQDRLILRARFEDGRTVVDIAAMVGLDQKPLYRRLERLFRDLRAGLETCGISAAEVRDFLGAATMDLEQQVRWTENDSGRPSMGRGADAWP
jgi:RNA polymerase sigma factor for flagellar operon FliA